MKRIRRNSDLDSRVNYQSKNKDNPLDTIDIDVSEIDEPWKDEQVLKALYLGENLQSSDIANLWDKPTNRIVSIYLNDYGIALE